MQFFPWYAAMMLTIEARNVIQIRLMRMALGEVGCGAELGLMVQEKVAALYEAGGILVGGGNPMSVIEMYRKHVAANARRLATPDKLVNQGATPT